MTIANTYGKVRSIDSRIKNLFIPGILRLFNDETVSLIWPLSCILALFKGEVNMYIRTVSGTNRSRKYKSLKDDGGIVGTMLRNDNYLTSK
jgi:hypothetical protein